MSRQHTVTGQSNRHKVVAKADATLTFDSSEATENVASWLQDVARRPWPQQSAPQVAPVSPVPAQAAPASEAKPRAPAGRRKLGIAVRQTLIMTALAGAFMQYYFIEVNLRIVSLHSVTVFAPLATGRTSA